MALKMAWAYAFGRTPSKSVYVKPTTEEARDFSTELTGSDVSFFLVNDVPVVWVWKNRWIDFENLRIGMERTLNRIPAAAGRIIVGKNGGLEISNHNTEGCLLEFQERSGFLPSDDVGSNIWSKYGFSEPLIPLEPFGRALISAKLTHFRDGCSLFVNFSHVLTDGDAMVKFMQIWSWETGLASNSISILPKENPEEVDCDHRLRKIEGVPTEFDQKDYDKKLTLMQVLKFMAKVPIITATDEVCDFEFSNEQWQATKNLVQKELGQKQWVSSYEAIMGVILKCLAEADGVDTIRGRVVVNIRGRSKLFPKNYFGCGLSAHEFENISTQEPPSKIAFALHESLRAGIEDMKEMEKLHLLPESIGAHKCGMIGSLLGGRLGMVERARYLSVWEKNISEDNCVINSWVGYPWLSVNFGLDSSKGADYIRLPAFFRFRRHVHIYPKTDNAFFLRMQLPKETMDRFKQSLNSCGVGFKEVPLNNTSGQLSSKMEVGKPNPLPGGMQRAFL